MCTTLILIIEINALPHNVPTTGPKSRPTLPLLAPKFIKLREHTAMIPPTATQGIKRFGVLKIVANPIAETAAAKAYSPKVWCGIILRSFTKLSIPQTLIAKAIPKLIARTISKVLVALTNPVSIWLSSISLTKLINGTPGTINRAQAINGCQGVTENNIGRNHSGNTAITAGVEI